MIDTLGKISQALQFLRLPVVIVGLVCLTTITVITFTSKSLEEDYYLIPSIVGVLWATTTYIFLAGFHTVPPKADPSWKLIPRIKRKLARAWYVFLAITFLGTSILAVSVTFRMVSVWVRDYLG